MENLYIKSSEVNELDYISTIIGYKYTNKDLLSVNDLLDIIEELKEKVSDLQEEIEDYEEGIKNGDYI